MLCWARAARGSLGHSILLGLQLQAGLSPCPSDVCFVLCAVLGRGLPCGHASSLQCVFNKCTCWEVGAEGTFLLATFSPYCVSIDVSWSC